MSLDTDPDVDDAAELYQRVLAEESGASAEPSEESEQ
jgi:hypothetical protein